MKDYIVFFIGCVCAVKKKSLIIEGIEIST